MTSKDAKAYPGFDVRELRFSGMLVADESGRQLLEVSYLIVTKQGKVVTADRVRYRSSKEMARNIAYKAREGLGE